MSLFITNTVFFLSVFRVVLAQNMLYSIDGDVNVAFIYDNCDNSSENYQKNTLIRSVVWSVERINFLDVLYPLKIGLTVYQTCTEIDYMETIFELYKNDTNFTLGVISTKEINEKVKKFKDLLDIRTKIVQSEFGYVVKASVMLLKALNREKEVTVIATDEDIINTFYEEARRNKICLKEGLVSWNSGSMTLNVTVGENLVVFAPASDISQLIPTKRSDDQSPSEDENIVIVIPLDGNPPKNMPENTYIILPPHVQDYHVSPSLNIFPTPLFFDVAKPLLDYVLSTRIFLKIHCNDTMYKVNCLRTKQNTNKRIGFLDDFKILNVFKIEALKNFFSYDIFHYTNITSLMKTNPYLQAYDKTFSYNIFYDNLTWLGEKILNQTEHQNKSGAICPTGFMVRKINIDAVFNINYLIFKAESWIYAFLSLSLLGIVICIAILIFLLSSIIQKTIFEGNPVLTLVLLFVVVLLFTSVLPFSLEATQSAEDYLCTAKILCSTLSFTAAFSLILSRAILLSTVSKNIGFMSHIAGPVQSFLCLFIFGVQAALSLHVIGRCQEVFRTYAFVYLMSYNLVLLALLLCLTPLIYKNQRNYREGKYITICVILISVSWSVWLPCFIALDNAWREFTICLGLVSTGGIFLGTIFIPRTYLMTIAAERDKITSALPSLTTAASAVDLYRAHTQPIYDCVNVTAINAATMTRSGAIPANALQQPDLYSCPALPEDFDFNLRCDSPTSTDKITRF